MVKIGRRKNAPFFFVGRHCILSFLFLLLLLTFFLPWWITFDFLKNDRRNTHVDNQNNDASNLNNTTRRKIIRNLSFKEDHDVAIRYNYQPPSYSRSQSPDCGIGPDYDAYFSLDSLKRSRFQEDKKLFHRFFAKHMNDENFKGTYVELGAFDGIRESNTRFYDECLGWDGLLIEGNPVMYDKLVTNRPNSHRLSYAPSCMNPGEMVEFYAAAFTNAGLSETVNVIKKNKKIQVPCGPLGPILEKMFPDGHITFFSLDVEGAEKLVLDTIDFDKIRIDVFMIEVENGMCKEDDCEVRKQVRDLMEKVGYKRKLNVVQVSNVFVHPDSPYVNE